MVRIERLSELGYELKRPEADYLKDGIHELRVALRRVQYRMLYFFSENQCVITHGFTKKSRRVPEREIQLAIERKNRFEENPMKHTYEEG